MKKIFTILIAVTLILIATVIGVKLVEKEKNEDKRIADIKNMDALSEEELRETIQLSMEWIKNAQEENGHFKYEYNPFYDTYSENDNMVRQAGTFYSMGEVLVRSEGDKYGLKVPMQKAIEYFKPVTFEGEEGSKTFKCVLKTENNCSIGATSLAMIGMLDLIKKYPDLIPDYEFLIKGYLDFIVYMHNPTAGFRDGYYLKGAKSEKESPFGNGEAFLALVRYYQYKQTDEVKYLINDVGEYFAKYFTENKDDNFYLWGMAAIKDIYKTDLDKDYFDFVKEYTDWRMAKFIPQRNTYKNKCAYIEVIASAYSTLQEEMSGEELIPYLEDLNIWLKNTKKLQITENYLPEVTIKDDKGKVLEKNPEIKNMKYANGGFLTSLMDPVQRIDFTQHCASSYLQKLVDIDGKSL